MYSPKPDGNLAKAKCQICHMGQDKKVRNPYGADLAKALGKENANPDETAAALKKVEGDKPAGGKKTYGELIKADMLPGAK